MKYYLLSDDFDGLLRAYANIGIICRDLKRFKEAEGSFLAGIEIAKKNKYQGYSLGILKANLSQIYLDHYKKYERAIELLNVFLNGVKKARYRLRKKMNLEDSELQSFLMNFSYTGLLSKKLNLFEN